MNNPSHCTPDPQLSWVVPMYCTSAFVAELCARIAEASQALGLSAELVLVDDACPQDSAAHATQVQCPFPIRVIKLPKNLGQDGAIRAGLRACRGGHVVILDGDLQDPPEALAELWPMLWNGYDAVFANRTGAYEARGRLLTSRIYRTAVRILGRLPPGAGLFVIINRKTLDSVVANSQKLTSILAAIAAANGHYTSVIVQRETRASGESAYGAGGRLARGIWSLKQIVRVRLHRMLTR